MFLTDRKLERRVQELEGYRYRDIQPLKEFFIKEDTSKVVNPEVPVDCIGWDTIQVGNTWSGRDKYLWMYKDITIPKEWKDKTVVGVFDYGNTGAGNNSGFESMCYINQKPYQGVDVNHKEVFFKEELAGTSLQLVFRLWSGLEGGGVPRDQEHRIERADLAWMDGEVDSLYFMGTMILDTIKNLKSENPIRYDLRNAMDGAFYHIDWSYPGSDEFYESVHKANEVLNEKIESMNKHSNIDIKCIGHTHIDVAWLWRLKHTREKASRSFSTVLRLMELYPEYIFLQTQPQLYEYIKEDFPSLYEDIKTKINEGQWECDGGMWVEADCNLTSGESLTRQILIGSKFIKDEFEKDVEYLWLPDVFGYSWALPQILKKSGIDMFMTTKISWNQYNRMPHDTFLWRGMDGSEVVTHFITTPDPWSEPGSWFYTYNGKLTPKTVQGTWEAYSEKEMNKELLISYGYGDGGGGVNRDNLEQRRCIDKIPGLPNLKTSTAKDYFRNLKETVKTTEQFVHTWDGELYLEYHRGTYTSQAHNKRENRKMELLYRRAEWLTVMKGIFTGSLEYAKQEALTKGWKSILTNQFHDIIPGSSIREVYEDSKKDYEWIRSVGEEVIQDFLEYALDKEESSYTVINSSPWMAHRVVKIPSREEGIYRNEEGTVLSAQIEKDGTYVFVENIAPMSGKKLVFETKQARDINNTLESNKLADLDKEKCSSFQVNGKEIETPFYQLSFNDFGQITRLYDKDFDREVLPEGEKANVLQIFEDKPLDNDAWDIDIFYQQKMKEVTELVTFEAEEEGELRLVIHFEWKYKNSFISQNMVLSSKTRRIDFETTADYQETHALLKVAFPVDIRSTYATYDIQYGNVRRPNHWNTSWDQARFETVGHRFADLSERDYGVSLLNDCKYGYDIKDNVMRLSLIRTATHPDYLQDKGSHIFTYSLLPHGGDLIEGRTVEEAFFLNEPIQAVKGESKQLSKSFLTMNNKYIEVDAVKKSEDGKYIVVRLHEFAGTRQKVNIKFGFAYKSMMEGDLRERPIKEIKEDSVFVFKPYEIKTILLEL